MESAAKSYGMSANQCNDALQECGTDCYAQGCVCYGGTVTGTLYYKADFCTYEDHGEPLTVAEEEVCESQAGECWKTCYRAMCDCDEGREFISEQDCNTTTPAPEKSCAETEQDCYNGCYQDAAASDGQTTKAVSQQCLNGCEAFRKSCQAQTSEAQQVGAKAEVSSARYSHVGAKAEVMARPIHVNFPHGSATTAMP